MQLVCPRGGPRGPPTRDRKPLSPHSVADSSHGHRQPAPPKPKTTSRAVDTGSLGSDRDGGGVLVLIAGGHAACMAQRRGACCMTFDESPARRRPQERVEESCAPRHVVAGMRVQRAASASQTAAPGPPGQPGFDCCTAVWRSSKPRRVQLRPRLRASPPAEALCLGVTAGLYAPWLLKPALEDLMPDAAGGAGRGC
ncbi:uncharacterized protein BDZ99DRAFT_520658 [Mytilinidion resinicola]|uniref:Uncharacterized protein n=1 Tax=Mytilinidion resinicola TaxID=574789 RepID=A0A6A6YN50_9PEZI|nr:uncharacterized protein BDZ99DRAFT_520658 [Mytilinidion resinicola]KAF2809297.1 hypothetical protein BDZ99DRAFT_520658 [Mytilinidion resinicola]